MNPYGYKPTYTPGNGAPQAGAPGGAAQPVFQGHTPGSTIKAAATYGSQVPWNNYMEHMVDEFGNSIGPLSSQYQGGLTTRKNPYNTGSSGPYAASAGSDYPTRNGVIALPGPYNKYVLPGLPEGTYRDISQGSVTDYFKTNFEVDPKNIQKWKTPTPWHSGTYYKRNSPFGIAVTGSNDQFTPYGYISPFALFSEDPFWGANQQTNGKTAYDRPIYNPMGLVNRIENMSGDQLNQMDFSKVKQQFDYVGRELANAYANKDFATRMGSSLEEQQNWLQAAYNTLVQRGAQFNAF